MTNFKSPYFSTSIKEFWRRWHISLSSWFRDYVYIPLGGNRCSKGKQCFNLFITFLLSGLWHGANWTFIAWGAIHGLAQIFENIIPQKVNKNAFEKIISCVLVFLFCNFAWVLFRAKRIYDAVYFVQNVFLGMVNPTSYIRKALSKIGIQGNIEILHIVMLLLILFVVDYINYGKEFWEWLSTKNWIVKWVIYVILATVIALFSQKGVAAEFVYFQF